MTNFPVLVYALGAGIVLGSIFFGGLWWTVNKMAVSRSPAIWFLGSLLLRMSFVIAGFYFAGRGDWQRLACCLLGFIIARSIVIRLTSETIKQDRVTNHAS